MERFNNSHRHPVRRRRPLRADDLRTPRRGSSELAVARQQQSGEMRFNQRHEHMKLIPIAVAVRNRFGRFGGCDLASRASGVSRLFPLAIALAQVRYDVAGLTKTAEGTARQFTRRVPQLPNILTVRECPRSSRILTVPRDGDRYEDTGFDVHRTGYSALQCDRRAICQAENTDRVWSCSDDSFSQTHSPNPRASGREPFEHRLFVQDESGLRASETGGGAVSIVQDSRDHREFAIDRGDRPADRQLGLTACRRLDVTTRDYGRSWGSLHLRRTVIFRPHWTSSDANISNVCHERFREGFGRQSDL